jgi:hypothetical protein
MYSIGTAVSETGWRQMTNHVSKAIVEILRYDNPIRIRDDCGALGNPSCRLKSKMQGKARIWYAYLPSLLNRNNGRRKTLLLGLNVDPGYR